MQVLQNQMQINGRRTRLVLLQEGREAKERRGKQCMMAGQRHCCVNQLPKVAEVKWGHAASGPSNHQE